MHFVQFFVRSARCSIKYAKWKSPAQNHHITYKKKLLPIRGTCKSCEWCLCLCVCVYLFAAASCFVRRLKLVNASSASIHHTDALASTKMHFVHWQRTSARTQIKNQREKIHSAPENAMPSRPRKYKMKFTADIFCFFFFAFVSQYLSRIFSKKTTPATTISGEKKRRNFLWIPNLSRN